MLLPVQNVTVFIVNGVIKTTMQTPIYWLFIYKVYFYKETGFITVEITAQIINLTYINLSHYCKLPQSKYIFQLMYIRGI